MKQIVKNRVVAVGKKLVWVVTTMVLTIGFCMMCSEDAHAKEVYLGECNISAYSPASNTPRGSRATSTGHTARAYHTIAVDMYDPLCSYGAKLRIEGDDTIYTVEDCGNLNHYGRDLDIFMDDEDEADDWGVRWRKVYLVLPDDITDKRKHSQEELDMHTEEDVPVVVSGVATSLEVEQDEIPYWFEKTSLIDSIETMSVHTVNHGITPKSDARANDTMAKAKQKLYSMVDVVNKWSTLLGIVRTGVGSVTIKS